MGRSGRNIRLMNTKRIGNASEARVLAQFVGRGWPVLLPFGEAEPYDMVIDRGKGFEKVQVKTARRTDNGCIIFNANSHVSGKRAEDYRGKADLFAVYFPETDKIYLLPVDEVPTGTPYLRIDPAAGNNQHGCRMAEDYELAADARTVEHLHGKQD